MSLFRRRLIFILFLVLFLMIAPLLILYTSGYRFDWTHRSIYKTGLLIVDYLPRDATFSIDGNAISGRAPHRLSGLAPRSYLIRIAKEDYALWEKRLWIPEYITTFVRHVTLFRAAPPTEQPVSAMSTVPHPTRAMIAQSAQTPRGLSVTLTTPEGATSIGALPAFTEIQRIAWSKTGTYVLIVGRVGTRRITAIVTVDTPTTPLVLDTLTRIPLTALTWDREREDVLIGLGKEGSSLWLYAVDVRTRRLKRDLVSDDAGTFPLLGLGNRVITFTRERTTTPTTKARPIAMVFRPENPKPNTVEQRVLIPLDNAAFRIRSDHDYLLTLIDDQSRTLFLIEREPRSPEPIVEMFSNVIDGQWSPNGRRFLYWNDHEIFLWDLEQNTRERLVRSDDAVLSVLWHPTNEYLFIQTKKAITILEIDGRDHRNTVTLVSSADIHTTGIDDDGQWLWTWMGKGKEERIEWYELK